jgi:hypothetical protein
MKRWMLILAAACALGACGDAGPAARPDGGSERVAEGGSKLAGGPATGSPSGRSADPGNHPPYQIVPFRRNGVVDSIQVRRDGSPVQTLEPSARRASGMQIERLSTPDLDFDGHADLALVTELAAGTSRSDYWRFDPRTGRYRPLGNHETLQVDPAARALTTFNRGGHGGRV